MGWFKKAEENTNTEETFHLDGVQGNILYAMDVETEDDGEFITFVATPTVEPVIEEEVDGRDNSGNLSE